MIRIFIKWDFKSPSLKTASGIVEVHFVKDNIGTEWDLLSKFRITCKPGSLEYSGIEGKRNPF